MTLVSISGSQKTINHAILSIYFHIVRNTQYHSMARRIYETQVLIIGGGATGTGIARDLSLRGVHTILVEQEDFNAGASGRNHGLLHSGARYVSNDAKSAAQCAHENKLLKKLAPDFIEPSGGLFIAIEGDDENYVADFPQRCVESGIMCTPVDIRGAREIEPALSSRIVAAFSVEDATIDPFALSLANLHESLLLGSLYLLNTKITGFRIENQRIKESIAVNTITGEKIKIQADQVINSAGAWSGLIAGLGGISLNVAYSKGTLLVTNTRITQKVINRLRPASDGDIIVPGGTVSILGTTSTRIQSLDHFYPTISETDFIVEETSKLAPALMNTRYIRAFSGIRPLVQNQDIKDDRGISREFTLIDHTKDGLANITTITGGKLTTFRYMAEKAADLVCEKLSIRSPSVTSVKPLEPAQDGVHTLPGVTPVAWFKQTGKKDSLLCECELVPKKVVNEIFDHIDGVAGSNKLKAIGQRSRIGKGSCQGTFCGVRLTANLYNRHSVNQDEGIQAITDFLQERWLGQRPTLWGQQLAQSELSESVYCGIFCLENLNNDRNTNEQSDE